jgi:hypothetical protein
LIRILRGLILSKSASSMNSCFRWLRFM